MFLPKETIKILIFRSFFFHFFLNSGPTMAHQIDNFEFLWHFLSFVKKVGFKYISVAIEKVIIYLEWSLVLFMLCILLPYSMNSIYPKVASSNTFRLEAHAGFFRLLMKGIFDPYVLFPDWLQLASIRYLEWVDFVDFVDISCQPIDLPYILSKRVENCYVGPLCIDHGYYRY